MHSTSCRWPMTPTWNWMTEGLMAAVLQSEQVAVLHCVSRKAWVVWWLGVLTMDVRIRAFVSTC